MEKQKKTSKKKKNATQHRKRLPKRSDSESLENNESECNRQMKNGRVVQSKEIAYAVPRGAIVDKKKGFHLFLEWVKRLEVVGNEARGVGQSQTKKTIWRHKEILSRHDQISLSKISFVEL